MKPVRYVKNKGDVTYGNGNVIYVYNINEGKVLYTIPGVLTFVSTYMDEETLKRDYTVMGDES